MKLTKLLKVKDSNRDLFGTLEVVMLKTVKNRANITIDNIYEVAHWYSNGVFTPP